MDASERGGPGGLLGGLAGLADPTRLRVLHVLERAELGVAELCEVLRLPQSTVSRHVKVLVDAGFLAGRAEGTSRLYRLGALAPGAKRLWRAAREELAGWTELEADAERLARRLDARREEAERFFAGAVGEWEKLRRELYGTAFLAEALLALLPRDLVVADLGCGTGDLAARLAPHVRRVHAVDRSATMLRAARRRVEGLASVELHHADLSKLPLESGSCDAALLVLVLAYAEDPAPVLREAARVLRPGGRLVLVDLARHDDERLRRQLGQARAGFEPHALDALLGAAGLPGAVIRPLAAEPGARGPALVLASAERPAAGPKARASRRPAA